MELSFIDRNSEHDYLIYLQFYNNQQWGHWLSIFKCKSKCGHYSLPYRSTECPKKDKKLSNCAFCKHNDIVIEYSYAYPSGSRVLPQKTLQSHLNQLKNELNYRLRFFSCPYLKFPSI
ncbi:hypothetical protein GJ496_001257 [Pomphorhynchus laevis]|nr:hypothetical protein GJ496_001257 [Pomphorhynchus laevis]